MDILVLLKRCQGVIGYETSKEAGGPHVTTLMYTPPPSEGERLRRLADKADTKDALIRDLREAVKELEE